MNHIKFINEFFNMDKRSTKTKMSKKNHKKHYTHNIYSGNNITIKDAFYGNEDFYNFLVENNALEFFMGLFDGDNSKVEAYLNSKSFPWFTVNMNGKNHERLNREWDKYYDDLYRHAVPSFFKGHEKFYNFLKDRGYFPYFVDHFNYKKHGSLKKYLDSSSPEEYFGDLSRVKMYGPIILLDARKEWLEFLKKNK